MIRSSNNRLKYIQTKQSRQLYKHHIQHLVMKWKMKFMSSLMAMISLTLTHHSLYWGQFAYTNKTYKRQIASTNKTLWSQKLTVTNMMLKLNQRWVMQSLTARNLFKQWCNHCRSAYNKILICIVFHQNVSIGSQGSQHSSRGSRISMLHTCKRKSSIWIRLNFWAP